MTKLVEIIQRDTFNDQRPKIQYIVDQVRADHAKKGWPLQISYHLTADLASVAFESYLEATPNEPRMIGTLPLKEFVDLSPEGHERIIQCLTLKFRMEVLR